MATPDEVKDLQRSDPVAKEQWHAYCETYGNGVRDPAKHESPYLQGFIQQYQSGVRLEYKEGAQLVKMVKMGQKKSQSWKAVWEVYCNNSPVDGRPAYDPAKHGSQFLEGFVEFMGKMAVLGSMGANGPPGRKNQSTGDPQKDILIAKIKAFQKRGEDEKQVWHAYCDGSLGGVYDPSRHANDNLQVFIDQNGIQDIPIPASVGQGGAGPANPLVTRIKAFQKMGEPQKQAWHDHCDTALGGIRDPSRHDAAALEQFISAQGVP